VHFSQDILCPKFILMMFALQEGSSITDWLHTCVGRFYISKYATSQESVNNNVHSTLFNAFTLLTALFKLIDFFKIY